MNDEKLPILASPGLEPGRPLSGGGAQADEQHPVRKLHRLFRGRYWLFFLLLVVLAGGGGYLGWSLTEPLYRSQGILYVEAVQRDIDDPKGQSVPPMLGAYVDVQIAYMQSPDVIRKAMQTETWKRIRRPPTDENLRKFAERLHVYKAGTLQINVSATDPDPKAAQAAVNALIAAYQDVSEGQKLARDQQNLDRALERERVLTQSKQALTTQSLGVTQRSGGPEALKLQLTTYYQELAQASLDLEDVNRRLRAAGQLDVDESTSAGSGGEKKDTGSKPAETEKDKQELTPVQIAVMNPEMARLITERDTYAEKIRYLKEERGLGPNAEGMKDAERWHRFFTQKIADFAAAFNGVRSQGIAAPTEVERLKAERASLLAKKKAALEKVQDFGAAEAKYEEYNSQKQAIDEDLTRVGRLIEELKSEVAGKGRIVELSGGQLPTIYAVDKRKQNVVLGVFGGGGLAFLFVLLLGVADRRLKSSDDLVMDLRQVRMLGLLPDLPKKLENPEEQNVAVHSVHHIRTMLQIGMKRDGSSLMSVTGPAAGTGKTTLTHVLGLSYAASGAKTLLVDADFVGRGLTRQFNLTLRRRIESALTAADREADGPGTALTELSGSEQILSVFAGAGEERRSSNMSDFCGQVVERLGRNGFDDRLVRRDLARLMRQGLHRSEREVLSRAKGVAGTPLEAGILREPGFLGLLHGEDLEECVESTEVEHLHLLPLGRDAPAYVDRLSTEIVRAAFSKVRSGYDVVIVDTGPIPGSIEASLVAAEVDSVVLIVSRGDQRPMLDRAVRHISTLGADIAGLVFNRADFRDAMSSSASHSVSLRSIDVE